jgi:transcriptional regulator with XRE-family HTH domain
MEDAYPSGKTRCSLFGQLLAEKRLTAGLTLKELAELSHLPLRLLEELEYEGREVPSFDVCYKIAEAINSKKRQGFVTQDLWQAASMDKAAMMDRSVNSGHLRREASPETKSKAS